MEITLTRKKSAATRRRQKGALVTPKGTGEPLAGRKRNFALPSSEWIVRLYPDLSRLSGPPASGRFCPNPDRSRNSPSNPFSLTLKGTSQNSGRLLPFFPYKMKITSAPKRLLAQRRRRKGACTLKGHRQPSSRSKRDLLGRRSGGGASEEYPILNWVFREQRSPP